MIETERQGRNPFPYQGAFSLEARESGPGGRLAMPPTLVVPALAQMRRLTAVYAERFGDPAAPRGQVLLVRGEHGAGKTHGLGYLMQQVADDEKRRSPRLRDVLQLYVKAEDADVVRLYRRVMAQLGHATLRDLAQRFYAVVTGETMMSHAEAGTAEAVVRFRDHPNEAYDLVGEYAVSPADVLERRDERLADVTGQTEDFGHAFSYLDHDELGDSAYRWYTGRPTTPAELLRLAVSGPIETAETAKYGLQLLASLCGRVGVALVLYVDQYEKLVLTPDGGLVAENTGLLHSLVEAIPQQDAMLVLTGNQEAWQALPRDLRDRFGYNVVEVRGLDLPEVTALVELYLHPRAEVQVDPSIAEDRIAPFTPEAIKLAHLQSRGNARYFIQLCHEAFAQAELDRGVADEQVMRRAVERAGTPAVEPQTVLNEVRALAVAEGFTVVDRVAGLPPGSGVQLVAGTSRVLVLLGQATHYYDEVIDAVRQLELIDGLRESMPGARVALVVLGYDSPEVREQLERAGVVVISYRVETFPERFGRLLGAHHDAAPPPPGGTAIDTELERVRAELESLRTQREADVEGLTAGGNAIARDLELEQIAARWQAATSEWAAERRRVEERIRAVRRERRDEELEELERLRAQAESERRERLRLAMGLAAVLLALAAVVAITLGNDTYRDDDLGFGLAFALAVVAPLVLARFFLRFRHRRAALLTPRPLRELTSPVTSVADLRRLAYRQRPYDTPVGWLVEHENPQVRYAAAVVDDDKRALEVLALALPGERSAIVRRAFAQRLGRAGPLADGVLTENVRAETAEVVYVYEGMLEEGYRGELPKAAPMSLRMLESMLRPDRLTPANRVLLALADSPAGPDDADVMEVDRAFRLGLPFGERDALQHLPIDFVRDAARAVSPFDEGGLGTFDHLKAIEDVDRAYLTLSHVLFLSELGLLVESTG